MSVELVVTDGPELAAEAAARLLVDAVRTGAAIALAGGSTPRRAYVLASAEEPDWGRAEVWLGDERLVPPDDPRSNARLVRTALLDRLTVPPRTHFVDTELPAEKAAASYHRELRGVRLDLVLLGIGPDGHTASLFPHAASLDEHNRLAIVTEPGLDPLVPRVTMTIPALAAGKRIVFPAVGAEKGDAVRRAFGAPPSPATPASLVRSATGATTAILDRASAALLR